MAKVVALTCLKGGVGKTSVTLNLAACLAERGQRVLAIDLDHQASLSKVLGFFAREGEPTVAAALERGAGLPIYELAPEITEPHRFDLVPASIELEDVVVDNDTKRRVLREAASEYDYIVLDTPPSKTAAIGGALAASDVAIIPTNASTQSFHQAEETFVLAKSFQAAENPDLKILGVLHTLYQSHRFRLHANIDLEADCAAATIPYMDTQIPRLIEIEKPTRAGLSMAQWKPNHRLTEAFRTLAEDVVQERAGRVPDSESELVVGGV